MDNHISASIVTIYERGEKVITTEYLAFCGCEWRVDMWGNVRAVHVCEKDMDDKRWGSGQLTFGLEEQRPLFDGPLRPDAD